MATDVTYTMWKSNPGGINIPEGKVTIHGGHGVAHRRKHGGLETPNGVLTSVTDKQLELLKRNGVFQTHLENKAVKIMATEPTRKTQEKIVESMNTQSPDRPLTDADFKEGGRAAAPAELKVDAANKLKNKK